MQGQEQEQPLAEEETERTQAKPHFERVRGREGGRQGSTLKPAHARKWTMPTLGTRPVSRPGIQSMDQGLKAHHRYPWIEKIDTTSLRIDSQESISICKSVFHRSAWCE